MSHEDKMSDEDKSSWDITITSNPGYLSLGLDDVWRYRDLIHLMAHRNYMVNYRQTVIGPLWYIIAPLMTTAVYTIVFGVIGAMPTDGVPPVLFYISGVVVWSNFSTNLVSTSDVFVANMGLFGKVYFPRLTIPIATVLTNLITLAVQVGVFFVVLLIAIYFGSSVRPSLWIAVWPLVFAANIAMAVGTGLLFSSLTTRYRDLTSMLGTALQLWMYGTPIFYPLSQVPEKWRLLAALNPVSTVVEAIRLTAFREGTVSVYSILISSTVVILVLLGGLALFHRAEMTAADTV
jgi:lipopolysaccharide transport system permease protein